MAIVFSITKDKATVEERFFSVQADNLKQISLLGKETLDMIKDTKADGWCSNRFIPDILTEGIEIRKLKVGNRLEIGNGMYAITQTGKKCYDGCPVKEKQGTCAMSNAVIFMKVIKPGSIKIGESIRIYF